MSIGMEDRRVPPKYLLEKALAQVQEMAAQKPEESAGAAAEEVSGRDKPAEQERIRTEMLAAIGKEVLPPYGGLHGS